MTHPPSLQQATFYSHLASATSGALLVAVAGSGKTTSIVQGVRHLAPGYKTVVFAFNKSIAETLRTRLPFTCQSSTFHSYFFDQLKRQVKGKLKVDDKKTKWILKDLVPDWKQRTQIESSVLKLVGYAKNAGVAVLEDAPSLEELFNKFGLDSSLDELNNRMDGDGLSVLDLASEVLTRSNAQTDSVDFDDMLYLPLALGITLDKVKNVIVDEAQDTNSIQRELLRRLSPRLIAVGDPNQSIYGFRGADSDALANLGEQFGLTSLPLSVSWRCARSIVVEAQNVLKRREEIAPDFLIQAAPNAPEGEVRTIDSYDLASFPPGHAILCRLNFPLVQFAFDLVRRNRKPNFLGRDLAAGLVALVKKLDAQDMRTLREKLRLYEEKEVTRLLRKDSPAAAANLQDRIACLKIFMTNAVNPADVIASIELLFSENNDPSSITLATIHRSKGLEWDSVSILDRKLLPSEWASADWELQQENNLEYVAVTRAKTSLTYITSNRWNRN